MVDANKFKSEVTKQATAISTTKAPFGGAAWRYYGALVLINDGYPIWKEAG